MAVSEGCRIYPVQPRGIGCSRHPSTGTLTTNGLTIDRETVRTYGPFSADGVILLTAYTSRTEKQNIINACVGVLIQKVWATSPGLSVSFPPYYGNSASCSAKISITIFITNPLRFWICTSDDCGRKRHPLSCSPSHSCTSGYEQNWPCTPLSYRGSRDASESEDRWAGLV